MKGGFNNKNYQYSLAKFYWNIGNNNIINLILYILTEGSERKYLKSNNIVN